MNSPWLRPAWEELSRLGPLFPGLDDAGRELTDPFFWARRSSARDQLAALLGLTPADAEREWFVTGHQNELFHPGILFKNFVIDRLARERDGVAIHIVADTDDRPWQTSLPGWARPITWSHPGMGASLRLRRLPRERWANILRAAYQTLRAQSVSLAEARIALRPIIKEIFSRANADRSVAEAVTRARSATEKENGWRIRYAYISDLCRTPAFAEFASDIRERADEFRYCFNAALARYRASLPGLPPNQPFAPLAEDELPFWIPIRADGGIIRRMDSDGFAAAHERRAARVADWQTDEISRAAPLLAPRAVTLTLFLRLFVADAFVHGRGGYNYDQVTDGIIRDFYRQSAPPLLGASADVFPRAVPAPEEFPGTWLSSGVAGQSPRQYHTRIRDEYILRRRLDRHNPEKLAAEMGSRANPNIKELIAQIDDLLATMSRWRKTETGSARSRALGLRDCHYRLRYLRAELRGTADFRAWRDRRLDASQRHLQAAELAARRDLPYFFYPPRRLAEIFVELLNLSQGIAKR